VAIPDIIYAGNHGCRISGPNIKYRHIVPAMQLMILRQLSNKLMTTLKRIKGVLIEKKSASVAAHYRNVKNNNLKEFHNILAETTRPYIISSHMDSNTGKKVIEFGPATWNKGKAAEWLMRKLTPSSSMQTCIPVCIGDDNTDESIFTTLKLRGINIRVGRGKQTSASYYLKNPFEVYTFLSKLYALKTLD